MPIAGRNNLDSTDLRSRMRGYVSRPIADVAKRPASHKAVADINSPQVAKRSYGLSDHKNTDIKMSIPDPAEVNHNVPTKYFSTVNQQSKPIIRPITKSTTQPEPMSAELCQRAQLLIKEMESDNCESSQTVDYSEVIPTFPIPSETRYTILSKIFTLKSAFNKTYALGAGIICLVVIGVYLGLSGFKPSQKVEAQIKAITAYSGIQNKPVDNGNYDETPITDDNKKSYAVSPDLPRILKIPSIQISSRIKRINVDEDNVLELPKNIYDAGWYDGSSKPGDDGATFIYGHVSGPINHGVFYYLDRVKIGDLVTIERGDGKTVNYKVIAAELFAADKVDAAKVLAPYQTGKNGLNIMTGAGLWDDKKQDYNQRLVIYAVLQ